MRDTNGWSAPPHPAPAWRAALGLGPRGLCRAVDADDQQCVLRAGHRSHHRNTGVRAWLESTTRSALIRTYHGPRAGDEYAEEARLFAAFGFRPIAHEEARTVTRAGPGMAEIMVFGWLAGLGSTTQRRRRLTVCFHRCGTGPWDELAAAPAGDSAHPWPDEDPDDAETPWPVDGPDEPAEPIG